MALNKRQALFVEKYLKLNNATKAAIEAGYSPKTAKQIGSRLLTNVDIASRVEKRTEKIMQSAKMEADEVLERMAAIARGNIGQFIDVNGDIRILGMNAPLHLIKRIKTKRSEKFGDEIEVEMYDAQSALVTIGKHWRLWDRANESDWREELRKAGISEGDLFETAVQRYAAQIETKTE